MKRLLPHFLRDKVRAHIDRYVDAALASRLDVRGLTSKVSQLEIHVQQIMSVLKTEHQAVSIPPKHLQVRVVGAYVPEFIESGYWVCGDINAALVPANLNLSDFQTILDFGCGCGRITRAMKNLYPASTLCGIDIDTEAIEWLKQNYASIGEFSVAPHFPPTSFPDKTFDFVCGVSVFTHLPEDMQFQWLSELQRITKVGGYLLLSVHGKMFYRDLSAEIRESMALRGFYYSDFNKNYGRSINLPDFYQTAFHSEEYVKEEWGKYFDVIDIQVERLGSRQDTVLLRRH